MSIIVPMSEHLSFIASLTNITNTTANVIPIVAATTDSMSDCKSNVVDTATGVTTNYCCYHCYYFCSGVTFCKHLILAESFYCILLL